MADDSRSIPWLPLLVTGVLLAGAGFWAGRLTAPADTAVQAQEPAAPAAAEVPAALPGVGPLGEQARRDAADPFAIGPVDAPVVMVVFSDYRCPFCARYSRVTEAELVEKYVSEGQLRIEWRDFPVFGDASMLAARAGRAAAAQGRFWEFNDAVYLAAPENGHHELDAAKLLGFAEQVGVEDLERFEREMLSDEFDTAIMVDTLQARSLGVTGTPSFIISGNPVVGAQPTAVFTGIIDRALAEMQ